MTIDKQTINVKRFLAALISMLIQTIKYSMPKTFSFYKEKICKQKSPSFGEGLVNYTPLPPSGMQFIPYQCVYAFSLYCLL